MLKQSFFDNFTEEEKADEICRDFYEVKHAVEDQDLTQLSDEDLKLLYDEVNAQIDYLNGMQLIAKLCCNSVYGSTASAYYRFFNLAVAEDITSMAKLAMMEVDRIINEFFNTWHLHPEIEKTIQERFGSHIKLRPTNRDICVYGDTDSRYVVYGIVFDKIGYKPKNPQEVIDFILFIEKTYMQQLIRDGLKTYIEERNGTNGFFIMELELIGGKGIYLKKKKYVMSKLWADGKYVADKGLIKATGVELVQGSTSKFVKDSMKKVIKMLLTPRTSIESVFQRMNIIVEDAKVQPPLSLCKTNSANKYDDYVVSTYPKIVVRPKCSTQLRAAASFNHFIEKNNLLDVFPRFIDGQKIFWYYCEKGEPYEVFGVPDGVDLADVPNPPKMDYVKQIQKLVVNPLRKYIFSEDVDTSIGFGTGSLQVRFKKQVKI